MKSFVVAIALAFVLAGAPLAQTPTQPPPAQPPATQPPPTPQGKPAPPVQPAAPAEKPAPPRPFPEGAKIAFVVLQRIVNESAEGKLASTRIQGLQQKKAAELNEKNKQVQTLQAKLEKEGTVMSVTAQGDLQKQIERLNVDIQRFTQDAQAEIQELQNQLQADFQQRIDPIIAQVGQEKGLHFIFNGPDSGLVWADLALDISAEVIKKLDAAPKTPPTAKPIK
jgi:outer membrane protein